MTLYRRLCIPKKKKCKKAKWLSEEALQIAEQRRDMKGKEEKERIRFLHDSNHQSMSDAGYSMLGAGARG